jgi:uncharacterized protein (TIGR00730 family)
MKLEKVAVFCASSTQCADAYFEAADRLGDALARGGVGIVYGGGSVGLMGRLADAAMAGGGAVIGIIPAFMRDLEWGHAGITELRVVSDMDERERQMIDEADALVALPGGCGTLQELLVAITWKRLALHRKPIVIVNTDGFFDPLLQMLDRCVDARFMHEKHRTMWTVVSDPADVLPAIHAAPDWSEDALTFASI